MNNVNDLIQKENVTRFFQEQRERITRYLCLRYGISVGDAEEAFCKGCHAMLNAIHTGKLSAGYHEHSLGKYLQTCCRNQMLKTFERDKREITIDFQESAINPYDSWSEFGNTAQMAAHASNADIESVQDGDATQQHEKDLLLMESILEDLPYPCKDLIWGKYKEGFSAGEMAMRLGYKGSRVAITTLSRCMHKLKKRFNSERRMANEE